MSILSNHATASVVKVQGEIDVKDLARGERTGEEVAKRMERASVLAQVDIHRAATHNKRCYEWHTCCCFSNRK